jgi:hypothetical protein
MEGSGQGEYVDLFLHCLSTELAAAFWLQALMLGQLTGHYQLLDVWEVLELGCPV